MSTSARTASARTAFDALIVRTVANNYAHWRTYPIVNGKRCKAEPVLTAAALVACFDLYDGTVPTVVQVKAALRRLVASGELELSTALLNGKEVRAYSPASRSGVFFVDGTRPLSNASAIQIDAAFANFGLVDTYRV